jgi:hypothetical protein
MTPFYRPGRRGGDRSREANGGQRQWILNAPVTSQNGEGKRRGGLPLRKGSGGVAAWGVEAALGTVTTDRSSGAGVTQ